MNNELLSGELLKPHRAAGMQLLSTDPNLGSETKLLTVHKTGGGVNQYCRRVHLSGEPAGRF